MSRRSEFEKITPASMLQTDSHGDYLNEEAAANWRLWNLAIDACTDRSTPVQQPVAIVTKGTGFGPEVRFLANGQDFPKVGTLLVKGAQQAQPLQPDAAEIYDDALSHAAFYVRDHCQDGDHHAEVICNLKKPQQYAAPVDAQQERDALPWKNVSEHGNPPDGLYLALYRDGNCNSLPIALLSYGDYEYYTENSSEGDEDGMVRGFGWSEHVDTPGGEYDSIIYVRDVVAYVPINLAGSELKDLRAALAQGERNG